MIEIRSMDGSRGILQVPDDLDADAVAELRRRWNEGQPHGYSAISATFLASAPDNITITDCVLGPAVQQPGRPTMCLLDHRHTVECAPIPRGESEIISYGRRQRPNPSVPSGGRPRVPRLPWRARFVAWWCSHASDFARGGLAP